MQDFVLGVDVLFDALCVLDITMNFVHPYLASTASGFEKVLIRNHWMIAKRYLRNWAHVELLSLGVPFRVSAYGNTTLQVPQ